MKHLKAGRKSKGRGVSLPEEMWPKVEQRVESLKPSVTNFSHYVRVLIDRDIRRGKSPFPTPDQQHGQALAA